jgi:hypothetical protein
MHRDAARFKETGGWGFEKSLHSAFAEAASTSSLAVGIGI